MKFIWLTILAAIIVFGIIFYMNEVAPTPMPGLTANGQKVDIGAPVNTTPSESAFEPLDLSSNTKKAFFIKSANAAEAVDYQNERTAFRTIGNKDAEVKMYVFSSLTCSHCAEFHTKVLKEIEEKYVDTGKVFFTYIDFPFDSRALAGAMVARCLPTEKYFPFLNVLFENQKRWAFKSNSQEVISEYAALQGMSKGDVVACLSDKVLQQSIIKNRDTYAKEYKISGTPTTLVFKGDKSEVIVGANKRAVENALNKMLK
ncbi:MAG: DsbA family protein [Alphaproteobacteria bacterium]|nr:DsbA family protein [Alphaproteobacteria bacterium]